ncbi:MAG: hypothetical protein QM765_27095 [Myxococcales bacterium]
MHSYDAWAIALIVVAFAAVPPSLVLPWISIFAAKPRTSIIFAAYTGIAGFLALGIAQLGRMVVGTAHQSDYHGVLVFALAIAIPTFGAACVMLGRSFTEKRVWKVIGSAALLGLGADAALFCLAIHQFILADRYRSGSEAGWIFGALFGGIPVALVGFVLLVRTSGKAAQAAPITTASVEPPSAAPGSSS